MGAMFEQGMVEAMKAYTQSAGYAEQALFSIKVVHTYGNELLELASYSKNLNITRVASGKQIIKSSFAASIIFLLIMGFYAYGLFFGGVLRWEGIANRNDEVYSSGAIIAVMFSTIFGAFGLGGMVPFVKAKVEGQVAGKLAHDTMNKTPIVDPTVPGKAIDENTFRG